jgi:hypothetical protein
MSAKRKAPGSRAPLAPGAAAAAVAPSAAYPNPASSQPAPAAPQSSAAAAASASSAKKAKTDGPMTELEERVRQLQAENLELKLQLKVGKEPNVSAEEKGKQDLTRDLAQAIARKAPDAELRSLLRTYVVRFSDIGEDREKLVEKHMDQLERMLMPSQVTKMCMWTLQQQDFFETATTAAAGAPQPVPVEDDTESVWATMLRVIQASPDQVEKFKTYREDARTLSRGLRFMTRECADLRQRVSMKNKAVGEEVRALQDILTPTQLAKYLIFVQENPAAISLLARVWNTIVEA